MKLMQWILVAGTGRQNGLSAQIALLAKEFGRSLAEQGFGLVIGGWPGVDYLVAQGFAEVMRAKGSPLADFMIQVVAEKRPVEYPNIGDYPDFKGGHIIPVTTGAREWIEALKFADAVVLLGGEGGTLETYYYANQEQRPVFPIACTGGDAAFTFQDIVERWELFPYNGYTKDNFTNTLSQPCEDSEQRHKLVQDVIELLQLQFTREEELRDLVFVSYAHEDRQWLIKLRSALRPLEKKAKLSVWDDMTLLAGDDFLWKITDTISKSKVAVLLVSDSFLRSEFIQQYELPRLLEMNLKGSIRLLWLLIEGDLWKDSSLAKTISVNDVGVPLASLSPSQQQDFLVVLRKNVSAALAIA